MHLLARHPHRRRARPRHLHRRCPRPTRRRPFARRSANSTATRSRTSATRNCWIPSPSGPSTRSLAGSPTWAAGSPPPATSRRSAASSSALGNASPDTVDGSWRSGSSPSRSFPSGSSSSWCSIRRSAGHACLLAAARPGRLVLVARPRCHPESPGRGASDDDPQPSCPTCSTCWSSAWKPGSASSRRSTAPCRLRARALSDEFARMLGEVRAGSSRADAMRAMEKRIDVARDPLVRARHPPGRHLRCVDRPGAAGPGRRDADQASPDGPGEGPEGPGEDADPDGVLHLPGAVRRRPRSRHHQHLPQLLPDAGPASPPIDDRRPDAPA